MYKLCQTEKSLARQRELENGFLGYLEQVPFSEMDIAGLCRYLQIPRKTFYRYFGTIEDALHALIDHRFQDLAQLISRQGQTGKADFHEDNRVFFSYWKEQQRFLDILSRQGLLNIIFARIHFPNMNHIREAYYPDADREANPYLYTFLLSSVMSVVIRWHAEGYPQSPAQMADIMQAMFTAPLLSQTQYGCDQSTGTFTKNS